MIVQLVYTLTSGAIIYHGDRMDREATTVTSACHHFLSLSLSSSSPIRRETLAQSNQFQPVVGLREVWQFGDALIGWPGLPAWLRGRHFSCCACLLCVWCVSARATVWCGQFTHPNQKQHKAKFTPV